MIQYLPEGYCRTPQVYNMVISTPGDANMTTSTHRKLRSSIILSGQNSTRVRNGLDKVVEEEEEGDDKRRDEEDYVDDEKDYEDENNDSSEEEEEEDEEEDSTDEEGGTEGENDEYEEDFVDDETEDSEDSQATFFPSAVNSDNDSNEEEEETENGYETLSLVEELENLGIRSDESNN
jgi:hypothetical protein